VPVGALPAPVGAVVLLLRTPRPFAAVAQDDYGAAAAANLWRLSLLQALATQTYAPAVAGFKFAVDFSEAGLRLCWLGYTGLNHGGAAALSAFAVATARALVTHDPSRHHERPRSPPRSPSSSSSSSSLSWATLQDAGTKQARGMRNGERTAAALRRATPADAAAERLLLLNSVQGVDLFVQGLVSREDALGLARRLEVALVSSSMQYPVGDRDPRTGRLTGPARARAAEAATGGGLPGGEEEESDVFYRPVWSPAAAQDACLVNGLADCHGLTCAAVLRRAQIRLRPT